MYSKQVLKIILSVYNIPFIIVNDRIWVNDGRDTIDATLFNEAELGSLLGYNV